MLAGNYVLFSTVICCTHLRSTLRCKPTQNGCRLKGVFLRVDFSYELVNIWKILVNVRHTHKKKKKLRKQK